MTKNQMDKQQSQFLLTAIKIYCFEIIFFSILCLLSSITEGRGISTFFYLLILLGGLGIFFERVHFNGQIYSLKMLPYEDPVDTISKWSYNAIILSFLVTPLIGVYVALEFFGV